MLSYWSDSHFADYLRGTKKPYALSSDDWDKWDRKARKKHPIRYWFVEVFLDKVQRIIRIPITIYHNIRCYLKNRFVDKTHILKSTLTPGKWYDLDTRMFYCLFDSFVDYIENEVILDNLKWEMNLRYNEDWVSKKDSKHSKLTEQALNGRKKYKIYLWWKYERPARKDPMDESGLNEFIALNKIKVFSKKFKNNKKQQKQYKKLVLLSNKLEEQYKKEDTKMLITLIKIRHSLWS